MSMIDIIRICGKFGIEIVLVGAGCWVVFYLIKNTVIRLGTLLDKLAEKIEKIGDKIDKHDMQSDMRGQFIKKEHEALLEQHKLVTKEHHEILQALGRINGFKNE